MKLMLCSVYNIHYTLKPTSNYSGTLDTLKRQLNQVLRLYLGGAVGGVVYKIKDEFRLVPILPNLIVLVGHGNPRSHSEDVGLGTGFVLIVEPHGAVGTEVIRISRFGGITAFDAVQATTRHHFALAVHNQVDLFGSLMMMREVCASRSKVNPEETGHDICLVDCIARCRARAEQEPVQN